MPSYLKNIKTSCSQLAMIFAAGLFIALPAEARFEFITQADGRRVVQTFAKRGEGLAAIIRALGLEPNWNDQSWLTNIQQANPAAVDAQTNFVVDSKTPIILPVDGLTMLKGHDQLLGQFIIPEPPSMTVETEPIPVPEPVPAEPVVSLPEKSPYYGGIDADFTIGSGFNNLNAERSSTVDTSLNSDLNLNASMAFGFQLTETQRMSLYIAPSYVTYSEPSTIALLQDNKWLFDLGATYGFRVGEKTFFNFVVSGQKSHFARFSLTNIEILAPWVYGLGIQLTGALFDFTNSAIWYTLTPKYLLSTTDILRIQSGAQGTLRLQWQPHLSHSGLILGGEYTYRDQDDSLAQQNYQTILGFLGYRF